jgi:hypothetical protein
MYFSTHNRALLRNIAAGTAMFAAAACSRSDRAGTGSDATQVQSGATVTTDTQSVATQPTSTEQATPGDTSTGMKNNIAPTPTSELASDTGKALAANTRHTRGHAAPAASDTAVSGYQPMGQDSSTPNSSAQQNSSSRDTVAVGDSSHIGKTGNRLEPTELSGQANTDTLNNQADSTRIRPPEDSTETVGTTSTSGGAPEMARDTTASLAQADTTAPQPSDTSAQLSQDSSAVQAQVDTTQQTEMAQQAPVDSAAPVQAEVDTSAARSSDSSSVGQTSEMAQQPADTAAGAVQADTAPGNGAKQSARADTVSSDVNADAAAVGAAGVQTGNIATGADAVALVTREGRRCTVVTDDAERRDMASSPATLNPCGTGTMTLPRVQAEER